MYKNILLLLAAATLVTVHSCKKDTADTTTTTPTDDTTTTNTDGLHKAFADFDTNNIKVYLQDTEIVIESNGLPNHTSPYWSSPYHAARPGATQPTTTHALFVAPTVTTYADMAPGYIDDFVGSYTLRVPVNATKATQTSSTGLGPIGIAVSGAMLYNDEEGPNLPLSTAAVSLDYTGAHTGPQSYHYHLETKAWSNDDEKLIGIISDGFFLYGRKCNATGTYPTDLDASGGHTSTTQHTTTAEYHYHIQNELYVNKYYILFPGDYQGTPNAIQ